MTNFLSCTALAFSLVAVGSVAAQAQEGDKSDSASSGEIIVTAQRRAEAIQDVPVAVTAVTTETLENANINTVLDLPRVAPSLNVQRSSRTSGARIGVRGIGTFGSAALEPSVGVFLDEGYVARAGSVIGVMLDISSAELLRGPQGTLFGRNASVGVLSLRSAAPKDKFEAQLTGEVGNGDRYRLEGFVNVPLSDRVALRVAALGENFGGLIHNNFDNKTYGGRHTRAARASLKANLSNNFTNTLRVDYTRLTGTADTESDVDGATIRPGGLVTYANVIGTPLPDTNSFNETINNYSASAFYRDKQIGVTNTAELDLGSGYTARLISMYRDWKSVSDLANVVPAPTPLVDLIARYGSKTHTQEFQFISPKKGPFDFVAGLYYLHDELKQDENYNVSPQYCTVILPIFIPSAVAGCQAFPNGPNDSRALFKQKTEGFAVYGQSNLKLTDTVNLVLGARYTKEDKDATENQSAANPGAALFVGTENTRLKLKDSRATYRVGLNWHPTEDILTYTSFSTGFKGGGFNSGVGRNLAQARRLLPETVKSLEIGAKTTLFDGSLVANVALYNMEVSGFQDRALLNGAFSVSNAGDIRNRGVELEGRILPIRSLSLNYAIAYLDSKFTSYVNAPNRPGLAGFQDLSHRRPNMSPEWSGLFGAQFDSNKFANGLSWMARSDIAYTGKYNAGLVNDGNPQTIQKSTVIVSARVSLYGPDRAWIFSAFGQNLTDKNYCLQKYYTTFSAQFGLSTPGNSAIGCIAAQSRTYGLSLSTRF